jgi:hypothetical protein
MKKCFYLKMNNKGATLIMVIISLAFIAVLGSIIMLATIRNIEMKAFDRKVKEDFYLAEAALDEIKVGLIEIVAKEMSEAYTIVLKQYSRNNSARRENLFETTFINGMKRELQVSAVDNSISMLTLSNLLKETKKVEGTNTGAELVGTSTLDITSTEGEAITLKGVKVTYILEGRTSSISTDIKIKIPRVTFDMASGYVENTSYKEYALIANQALCAEFSSHKILGSVYAGSNGIDISNEGNTLQIIGGKVISAGNITVKDKAKLWIYGSNAEVWATNLVTTQSDKKEDRNKATTLLITANSYVKDDLVLDAKKSDVELSGEYYGYSNGTGAENNSAIIINAINAALKLDGLEKLSIAGRAFVSLTSSEISYDIAPTYGAVSPCAEARRGSAMDAAAAPARVIRSRRFMACLLHQ